jgi:nitrate reductase NapD
MPDGEYHIASYVVRARAEDAVAVTDRINSVRGLEVHAEEQGKIVVTAEAENVRELADFVACLESLEGVIAVAPVYHEYLEAADAAHTTLPDENGRQG